MDYLIEANARKAVVHCIEIMGLKNPEQISKSECGGYIHINTRGRKRLFMPYGRSEYVALYEADPEFRRKKLHRVMTFYITENDCE